MHGMQGVEGSNPSSSTNDFNAVKFLNFSNRPFYLKFGLIFAFLVSVTVLCLPDKFTNLAYVPWYLGWLILPAFIVFSVLCILFRIDFVSNFHPSEGPWRHVILPVFWFISLFLVTFLIGIAAGFLLTFLKKPK